MKQTKIFRVFPINRENRQENLLTLTSAGTLGSCTRGGRFSTKTIGFPLWRVMERRMFEECRKCGSGLHHNGRWRPFVYLIRALPPLLLLLFCFILPLMVFLYKTERHVRLCENDRWNPIWLLDLFYSIVMGRNLFSLCLENIYFKKFYKWKRQL